VGYQPTPVGDTPTFEAHRETGDFYGHMYNHIHRRDLPLVCFITTPLHYQCANRCDV
jgi:hypothetical protein